MEIKHESTTEKAAEKENDEYFLNYNGSLDYLGDSIIEHRGIVPDYLPRIIGDLDLEPLETIK